MAILKTLIQKTFRNQITPKGATKLSKRVRHDICRHTFPCSMFSLYSRSSRESVISDFVTLNLFLVEILVVNMTGPKEPHQPRTMNFPYRSYGKKNPVKRCFRPVWFDTFKWLHHMETSDSVTCHHCISAIEQKKITSSKCQEDAFIKDPGYRNWREASARFAKHEKSNFHKEAVLKSMPSMRPIDELMYTAIIKSK